MSPREGAQTAKRAQVQADVLRATEELLSGGSSYADLGVERIATAAGISRTAFYFYFRDKRDLLMRLAGDVSGQLYGQADIWFSGQGEPAAEIRQALDKVAAMYQQHAALLRAIVEVSTYDEEIATYWRTLLDRFVDATERRILTEQEAGAVEPMPARATAFALVWMTERTLYQQLVQNGPVTAAEQADALVGIWIRAIYGRT